MIDQACVLHCVAVRVMDCEGEGAMSTIVTGLEWIHDNMIQPAVVLMSIGGTGTLLLDQACQSLVNAGAVVVVAAGNDAEGRIQQHMHATQLRQHRKCTLHIQKSA